MGLAKKITQVFSLVLLTIFLVSCKDRCYDVEEFDSYSITINSSPITDGVEGTYDAVYGGQQAEWYDTGLKSNGDPFIIVVSGSWTGWGADTGDGITDVALAALPRCDMCAKKRNGTPNNCICSSVEAPTSELNQSCGSDKDNSVLCTCTNNAAYGKAEDYGVYHFPLNYYDKNETVKIADKQSACKYDRGMGAYVGLFGSRGVAIPSRAYHLYSEETLCNITRNSANECKDSNGVDRTGYIFRSANNRIFMKTDNATNDGSDTFTGDDVYHDSSEVVKFKISDSYYNDNYGKYNVTIMQGVGQSGDSDSLGILEHIVRMVENVLLGDLDSNKVRQGGILEGMFKSIVQDTGFILLLQVSLSLYITFYGIAVLFGVAEISKKELMSRVMKIGLILFFTGANSWYFYNQLVVGFFYDSMNYVVSMMTSLASASLDLDTTAQILKAQLDRVEVVGTVSSASRFAYIDNVIMMLLSEAAAAKIFALGLSVLWGPLYILIIYVMIVGFIYVMLIATVMYAVNIMKIIFVLSLGPIFICFTLFSQTNQMFKNWLGYLAGRSMEIILMFFILFAFVSIININFNEMLGYKACLETKWIPHEDFRFFSLKVLVAYVGNRSLTEWIIYFTTISGLIFITKLLLDKIPSLSGGLVSVGGVGGGAGAGGGAGIAAGMMGGLASIAKQAAGHGFNAAGYAASGAGSAGMSVARATGIAGAVGKMTSGIPNPAAMYRNSVIDAAISKATKDAASKGLKGKDADAHIRAATVEALQNRMLPKGQSDPKISDSSPKTMAAIGMDLSKIAERLDKKLVQDPMAKVVKDTAKKLKSQDPAKIPSEKEMRQQIRDALEKWGKDNLSVGSEDIAKHLDKNNTNRTPFEKGLRDLIKKEAALTSSEAAKAFQGNPELQNKHLQHLMDKEAKRHNKAMESKSGALSSLSNYLGRAGDRLSMSESRKPKQEIENFMRQLRNQERNDTFKSPLFMNPTNQSNTANKIADMMFAKKGNSLKDRVDEAQKNALKAALKAEPAKGLSKKEMKKEPKKKDTKEAKDARKDQRKREFMQEKLRQLAVKSFGVRSIGGNIRNLERKGKMEMALKAKQTGFAEAMNVLFDKDENGKAGFSKEGGSLFEKAAVMSYMQQELGVGGKDASSRLSELMKEQVEKGAKDIADRLADTDTLKKDSNMEALENDMKNLQELRSGLFAEVNPDNKYMVAVAAQLAEEMEQIGKGITGESQPLLTRQPDGEQGQLGYAVAAQLNPNSFISERDKLADLASSNAHLIEDQKESIAKLDELNGKKEEGFKAANQAREKDAIEAAKKAAADKEAEDKRAASAEAAKPKPGGPTEANEKVAPTFAMVKDKEELLKDPEILQHTKDIIKNLGTEDPLLTSEAEKINKEVGKAIDVIEQNFDAEVAKAKTAEERQAALEKAMNLAAGIKEVVNPEKSADEKTAFEKATEVAEKINSFGGEVKVEPTSLVAHDFKVEFGLSIGDALSLFSPDVLLKESNPFLGVADAKDGEIDHAMKNALGASKSQSEMKLKMKKMDAKMKEFKLSQMPDGDEKSKLQAEIDKLDSDINRLNNDLTSIDNQLSAMK